LALFAAGAALLALLFASYSRRSTWLALGSTVMSMVALVGCMFVITSHDANQLRTRLAWVGSKLEPVLDKQTVNDLKTAIAYVWPSSSCGAGERPGCETTASAEPPAAKHPAMQAASTTSWLDPKQDAEPTKQDAQPTTQDLKPAAPDSPATWRLGDARVEISSSGSEGLSISGTNLSDQALEEVHAVLKPDSGQREVELVLNVEGHNVGGGAVIPPGARFSLAPATKGQDGAKPFGGAILTFRYVQAGQRKNSILYLTPSMVGHLANRG
jgi:hypothetical protein